MERNDDALTQANGPIGSGITYYGTFPSADDLQDYFHFDLATSSSVEIWLANIPVGSDYDLVLRDSALRKVGKSATSGNASEYLTTGILSPGRY